MRNPSDIHVLIVEDDEVMQMIVKKKLEAEGFLLTTVGNGIQAIEALKSKKFHCVLMDINMPEQDGMDAIRWIRDSEDEYYKNLPVFALTTYSTSDHTKEILEAGMNDHLVKPFDLQQFKELLNKFIS
jgi:two-component system, sensor histidine kinase